MRKMTRWWRRAENRTICFIVSVPRPGANGLTNLQCKTALEELAEEATVEVVSTECMHIYCKVRAPYAKLWRQLTALRAASSPPGPIRTPHIPNVRAFSMRAAVSLGFRSGPYCKKALQFCPFPATALVDPCRMKKLGCAERPKEMVAEQTQMEAAGKEVAGVGGPLSRKKRRGGAKAKAQRERKAAQVRNVLG